MLSSVPEKDRTYKTLFGGVFATFADDKLIKNKNVDYICRGEGEEAVMEMCKKLCSADRIDNVRNFTLKVDGQIYRNPLRPAVDLDTVPIPDWDLFDPGSICRPMQGKIWRCVGFETQRGCPYTCTYCNSPGNNVIYKEEGNRIFHRKKSIKRIKQELDSLVKKYDPELIYFVVDTFLAMSHKEFDEFKEMYMDYKIPFWMNTRAETITEHRAEGLEEMNMLRTSIGLEHGNAEYRQKVILKGFDNQMMIDATQMLYDAGIPISINNIIGFPGETRSLIFDTIELNRKLKGIDTTNVAIFAPFHGTPLRKLCLDMGYIKDSFIPGTLNTTITLKNISNLPGYELEGLRKTFAMYSRMPKKYWGKLKKAERNDKQGNLLFKELAEIYTEKYFGSGSAESN